ncbi:MAG TPA: hypothetical protein VMF86_05520 [Stellaceae bacterium]|nr:hypothetical protein [Stellaceae bacterium]
MSVTPNSAILPQTPRSALAQIANSNGTSLMALATGGANASKVTSIVASNTDTTAYTLQLVVNIGGTLSSGVVSGGTNYPVASVALPASAGNLAGTPPVGVLSAANIPGIAEDSAGQPYLTLNAGDYLCVALTAAVSAGKLVSAIATIGDF